MTAVRAKTIPAMMRRYRKQLEVLVIEDVQFLSGKSGTQLELFHTVQELVDGGARVVFKLEDCFRKMWLTGVGESATTRTE